MMLTAQLVILLGLLSSHGAVADVLLRGGTVISFNHSTESLDILPDTSVHIVGDRIAGFYDSSSFFRPSAGTEVVDVSGHIVSPGFVDAHRHAWSTQYKGLLSNTTFATYAAFFGATTPLSSGGTWTADDVYVGERAGLLESLDAGVTTVIDHAHHTWSPETAEAGLRGAIASGLRVFWCYAVQDYPVSPATTDSGWGPQKQLEQIKALVEKGEWKNSSTRIGIAFDGVAEPLNELDTAVFDLAKEIDAPVMTLHAVGGPYGGDGLPQVLSHLGFLNTSLPIVISHASFLSSTDIALLRSTDQFIALTPESEMHYGLDHNSTHLVQEQAALGVDTHATFSADVIGQARLWLQSERLRVFHELLTVQGRVPANNPMSVNQAFLLATRNGGRALRRDDLGVLAVGAKADITVFSATSPNMLGVARVNPVAAVVLHSHVGDVKHVLVDGVFKKRDGRILVDWKDVGTKFLASQEKIRKAAVAADLPGQVFLGPFGPAGDTVVVDHVDVVRGAGTGY
ncbi:Metallo-dependent hydrolase [Exidia glandulosa HHB12029]|uniref:Metallo-dependent hydrolase n=1 Tax=Exidia glandulosa HHB12029 TaxID=1314781 RepID=A0A165EDT4_EXIGL|nr:Metallo-dependent hydrolase [Exidia glandulosa HHB12029]